MGFASYRVSETSFERFYDLFLQNNFVRKTYQITSTSGERLVGVPTASSIVDPRDPDVSFFFQASDGRAYRIPFRELADAVEVPPRAHEEKKSVAMFDQFAVKTSIFTPLFERFVQNWRQPRRYLITLRDGESRVGIPLAHTYTRPEDPDTFLLPWQGTLVAIPFSEIDRVEEIRGVEELPIVGRDQAFDGYGVRRIW